MAASIFSVASFYFCVVARPVRIATADLYLCYSHFTGTFSKQFDLQLLYGNFNFNALCVATSTSMWQHQLLCGNFSFYVFYLATSPSLHSMWQLQLQCIMCGNFNFYLATSTSVWQFQLLCILCGNFSFYVFYVATTTSMHSMWQLQLL